MKKSFTYSPHPIDSYRLDGMTECEIRSIETLDTLHVIPAWNLFWLSVPSLDMIPGSGPNWSKFYNVVPQAAATLIGDATLDPVMFFKLRMHPHVFIEWFERQDWSIYMAYELLGEDKWVDTVLNRASDAEQRINSQIAEAQMGFIPRREGNVHHGTFRRRA